MIMCSKSKELEQANKAFNIKIHKVPAFLDTLVQILEKQLPCDQNPHHNPTYKCKAFSKHISFSHSGSNPAERTIDFKNKY